MSILKIFLLVLSVVKGRKGVRFFVVGDWGIDNDRQQYRVADSMGDWATQTKPSFIISTGDNFYYKGLSSATDRQIDTTWRQVYTHDAIADLPWYISLGNHDHGWYESGDGREWYQVDLNRMEPRWVMPDLKYAFTKHGDNFSVLFVSIDTQSLLENKNNASGTIAFLEQQLKTSSAQWKIVFGHHPAYSDGTHDGEQVVQDRVVTLMERYDADLYVCGHDHNLQHIQPTDGRTVEYIISGGGSMDRKVRQFKNLKKTYGVEVTHFYEDYGFASFVVTREEITVEFVSDSAQSVYKYSRKKRLSNLKRSKQLSAILHHP